MYILKLSRRHPALTISPRFNPGPLYGTVDMILRLYTLSSLLQGLAATSMVFASPGKADQTIFSPPHTPETDSLADLVRPAGNLPTLADLLTLEGRASIFYSYARETDMSARFVRAEGEGEGTTVFVPTNKAVQALARKPYVLLSSLLFTGYRYLCMFLFILFCRHEDPEGTAVTSTDASQYNVQRWVGAHIIPVRISDFFCTLPLVHHCLIGMDRLLKWTSHHRNRTTR